ncbi:MAG: phytanoyl-CoA dioxygenase family protein [Chloroflexi bacterium]|nr:phytanoyl-CoA dioxygenase family protein [Chloroflexota bacterium]
MNVLSVNVLTDEQRRGFDAQGYLLISGLIPPQTAAQAADAMWRALGADPEDEASWRTIEKGHRGIEEPALTAVYTPQVLQAAAELSGDDPATFRAPSRAYAINIFPTDGEWHWPSPHIDHAIKEHGHKTFPRAFRLAAMTFLNDVPQHGAGTVVWPGSHRKLEALAKSDPERYELMWSLGRDLARADLGEPVELTPRRGDVLFYHYLCAHAGSMNTSRVPRLALNMKW